MEIFSRISAFLRGHRNSQEDGRRRTPNLQGATMINSAKCGAFLRVLRKRTGSVYMLIWRDVIVFAILYTVLNVVYRHVLKGESKIIFEDLVLIANKKLEFIPMALALTFFVVHVMQQKENALDAFPNLESIVICINAVLKRKEEIELKNKLMLYAKQAYAITLMWCPSMKEKFSTVDYFENDLKMTKEELEKVKIGEPEIAGEPESNPKDMSKPENNLKETGEPKNNPEETVEPESNSTTECCCISVEVLHKFCKPQEKTYIKIDGRKQWVPINSAVELIMQADIERFATDKDAKKILLDEFFKLRTACAMFIRWNCFQGIPLAYAQVVILSVYAYSLFAVVGGQLLTPDPSRGIEGYEVDIYVPVYTLLQIAFYVGWLRVGGSLYNYFGEDDGNLDVKEIYERTCKMIEDLQYGSQTSPETPSQRSSTSLTAVSETTIAGHEPSRPRAR